MHIQIGFQTIVGHLIASIQIVLLTVASQWGDKLSPFYRQTKYSNIKGTIQILRTYVYIVGGWV